MSHAHEAPSSPPFRSPSSQTSPPPERATPNRSSSYFTYPVSYAVSGILRRLNTESSPTSEAKAKSDSSSSNRNSIGNLQAQLHSTASSLSQSLASIVSSNSTDMNSVFQPAHRTASPFQPPPLTPLSLKGWRTGMREKGKLLTKALAEEIRLLLPPRLQLVDEWSLAYSLEQNGVSLATLYKEAGEYRGRRGGFVLVVKDGDGGLFGAYLSEAPHPSPSFYGNGECFLWRAHVLAGLPDLQLNLPPPPSEDTTNAVRMTTISSPKTKSDNLALPENPQTNRSGASTPERIRFKAFPYSGVNDFMIFCEHSYLSVGAGDGHYGLWLDDNLEHGVSDTCPTFGNEPLSDEGKKFGVLGVELCLGRNVITFHTRYSNQYFTVHADLFCNNSKYFKRRLQNNRKIIDGDCAICKEKLDPKTSVLTFCEARCGQNFHKHCIDEWKRLTVRETTCPLCRESWKTRSRNIGLPLDLGNLDLYAIHAYVNWLYTGELHIDEAFNRQESSYNLELLRTWRFSVKIEDENFKKAIIAECVTAIEKGAKGGFDPACIKYAGKHGPPCMEDFLVDVWLMGNYLDHIQCGRNEALPFQFVRKLCVAASARSKESVKHKNLLEKHTEGEYEYQTETEDGESTASESEMDTDGD
ncbi:oxidation resistance protein 1 [Curvularia clavata]|uniref:Oxidation resistance protein 1 n=1 Tax=Curvularia clavata TaxID=95742 RepID=A0A9Q8YZN7_CURCL|nr:oxidation resistance protein 1 [Curvularia clavata]